MSARYPGAIISKTPPVPAGPYQSGAASGVWTLDQQLQYQKQGIWPTAGLTPKYIEDVFSTYLYQQNTIGYSIPVATGVGFISTSAWHSNLLSTTAQAEPKCAFDSAGNYYVAVSEGSTGGYVAKFSSDGTKVWLIKLSPPAQFLIFSSIKVSASGNVYVAGVIANANSPFICKLNSSGAVQWTQYISGGANGSIYSAMELDASENIHYAYSTVTTQRGAYAKFNSSGVQDTTVSKVFYTATQTYIKGITVDATGNIYICGFYYDSGTTYYYGFVAKFNSSMAIQWNRALYTINGSPSFNGVAVDGSGNVYVTGTQRVTTDEFLIVKYNSAGTLQWQNAILGGFAGFAIKVDTSGTIYAVGNGNSSRWQILKVSTSGTLSWQSNFRVTTGNNYPYAYGLDIDSSSNLLVVGNTNETTSTTTYRTNLIKINQDGSSNGITIAATLNPSSWTFSSTSGTSDTRTFTVTTGTTFSSVTFTAASDSLTTAVTNIAASTSSGGMLWVKNRTTATNHLIFPTATTYLSSNTTAAAASATSYLTSQSSNGFLIPSDSTTDNFVSWSFKKQPKFFDIVTFTGDGTDGRAISHSLGSVPGCIIMRKSSAIDDWYVYHRSGNNGTQTGLGLLNSSAAFDLGSTTFGGPGAVSVFPTSTTFTIRNAINATGATYIAYLFAHDAGGFGAAGTDNVITCGSFTVSAGAATVNLGYEPQWLLFKQTNAADSWREFDNMRGWSMAENNFLFPNASTAETASSGWGNPTATGFTIASAANGTYIYIAIRRGPMKTPTTGTSVYYAIPSDTGAETTIGLVPDTRIMYRRDGVGSLRIASSRLQGENYLMPPSTAAEVATGGNLLHWDATTNNVAQGLTGGNPVSWFFKRAPGFFDEVCFRTQSSGATTVTHGLGVAPELMIVKSRAAASAWYVYSAAIGNTGAGFLNSSGNFQYANGYWDYLSSPAPTATQFTCGTSHPANSNTVAYLFATCPGVSKVGSYTGTGATQTISCGFTGGARFVLVKRTDTTGSWYVWDTARGMVSGTDPSLLLNSTAAEVNANSIYTATGGFQIVSTAADINASGGAYIYLAIA